MKICILISALLLMLIGMACTTRGKEVYRLSDERLANMMLDMHLADALLVELPPDQQDSIKKVYWKRMEDMYQLSEEEIKEEILKLEKEPEKMELILGRVKQLADSIQ